MGIEVRNPTGWLVVHGNVVERSGVDWKRVPQPFCPKEMNAHGVLITTDASVRSTVVVAGNQLRGLSLGHSEALAVNGAFERVHILRNHVVDVDNIGIDVIGGEEGRGQPQKVTVEGNTVEGLRCGNPSYANSGNRPCEVKGLYYPAAAGIYLDGALESTVRSNQVCAFERGLEVGSENDDEKIGPFTVEGNSFSVLHGNPKNEMCLGGGKREYCSSVDERKFPKCD